MENLDVAALEEVSNIMKDMRQNMEQAISRLSAEQQEIAALDDKLKQVADSVSSGRR